MLKSFQSLRPLALTSIMPAYYGVIGPKAGIFNTWDEAKECTSGVSRARCKKFNTLKEAQDYLADHNHEFYSTEKLAESRVASKILLDSDCDYSKPVAVKKKYESKTFPKFDAGKFAKARVGRKMVPDSCDISKPAAAEKKFKSRPMTSYDELTRKLEELNQRKKESLSSSSQPQNPAGESNSNSKRSRSPSTPPNCESSDAKTKRRRLLHALSISDSDEESPAQENTSSISDGKRLLDAITISDSDSDSESPAATKKPAVSKSALRSGGAKASTDEWGDDDVFNQVPEFILNEDLTKSQASGSSKSVTRKRSGPKVEYKYNSNGVVVVYTDGACSNNGKLGAQAGIGVWFNHNHPLNISEPVTGPATNNNAEIQAATRAIQQALKAGVTQLEVKTDSQFLISCITQWIHQWKKNGWRLASGGPVKNKEKLVELDEVMKSLTSIKWTHVDGHKGVEGNEAADELARQGALKYKATRKR